jgi:hypothetical protein
MGYRRVTDWKWFYSTLSGPRYILVELKAFAKLICRYSMTFASMAGAIVVMISKVQFLDLCFIEIYTKQMYVQRRVDR